MKYCSSLISLASLTRYGAVTEQEGFIHPYLRRPSFGRDGRRNHQLAEPQIGVQKQIFVYDVDDDPQVIINPKIVESSGEWVYDEGCLSIPGLYVEMLRPKKVLVSGFTLEGDEVQIEADELLARLFQHEIDHLQGVLMFDRMLPDQRELAIVEYAKVGDNPANAEPVYLRLS